MTTPSTTFRPAARWVLACLVLARTLQPAPVRAEYHYFDDVKSGSEIVMKEVRWPYGNGRYYNTWFDQGWTGAWMSPATAGMAACRCGRSALPVRRKAITS
jgi:hypothetical protein